jgi:hypothetical protein
MVPRVCTMKVQEFGLASVQTYHTKVRKADAPAHRNARTQDVTLTPRSPKRPRGYPEGGVAGLSACWKVFVE